MHKRGRMRGKVLRYIKNPSKMFFNRIEPLADVRAIKGQHHVNQLKNRKPELPDHTIPEASKPKK